MLASPFPALRAPWASNLDRDLGLASRGVFFVLHDYAKLAPFSVLLHKAFTKYSTFRVKQHGRVGLNIAIDLATAVEDLIQFSYTAFVF